MTPGRDLLLSRRTALSAGGILGGAALLAACGNESGQGSNASSASSGSAAPASGTPVEHPEGLDYGTWLRPESHVLDAGGTQGVLVEFLDFECESCGAVFPIIEQVREEFAGELTYALRYLPLDGHANSRPAAHAAEAAARQGRLEEMYRQLFERQAEWGEQEEGAVDDLFVEMAETIGLDMEQWQQDRASDAVAERVEADVADAEKLRLTGTPSFFLDGEPFQPESQEDLRSQIREAIG